MKNPFLLIMLSIGVLAPAFMPQQAEALSNDILPPIPPQFVESIIEADRPFLFMERSRMRDIRRRIYDPPLIEGTKAMRDRAEGYLDPNSPWYVDEGPFERDTDFHPRWLSEERFRLYAQIVMDLCATHVLDPERKRVYHLQVEFERLLDQLEGMATAVQPGQSFDPRHADMLTMASFLYETIYMRLDTVRRHKPNQRIRFLRDHLAARLTSADMLEHSPTVRARVGASLLASTIFSMTVNPVPGKKASPRTAGPMLSDLYLAIKWLRSGMDEWVSDDGRLNGSIEEIHHALQFSIPLLETVRRHGYPFALESDTYSRLVEAIETHRLPGGDTVVDFFLDPSETPWLPRTVDLKPEPSTAFLEREGADLITLTEADTEDENELATFSEQNALTAESVQLTQGGGPTYRRGDIYERMLPRLDLSSPQEAEPIVNQDANWQLDVVLPVPRVWSTLYALADQYDPNIQALERWQLIDAEVPTHSYYILLYRSMRSRTVNESLDTTVVLHPELQASLTSARNRREEASLATVSATNHVVSASASIDHISFLLGHEGSNWRWFHESNHDPTLAPAAIPTSATPLKSPLFSVWEPESPSGRTLMVRRHPSGMSGTYSVVVHLPDENRPPVEFVNLYKPDHLNLVQDPNVNDWVQLRTQAATATGQRSTSRHSSRNRFNLNQHGEGKAALANLNLLFSPRSVGEVFGASASFGAYTEVKLNLPGDPFFYIAHIDLPGSQNFDVKYPELDLPGQRAIEWSTGFEVLAVRQGDSIETPMIESDADFVLISQSESLDRLFYLMVNGTRLRVKTNPFQRDWRLLIDAKDRPITAAWSNRRLFTTRYPRPESVFFAPDVLGFESTEGVVHYGRKGRQVFVHSPSSTRF